MAEFATPDPSPDPRPGDQRRHGVRRRVAIAAALLVVAWAVAAYLVAPVLWKRYIKRHPEFGDMPAVTHTGNGIPGDPLNVALIGSKDDLVMRMLDAKWNPADALSLKSSLDIAFDSVLKRPDPDAPVSNLFLFGRKEDFAFEQAVGDSPRHRHHVRFWKTEKQSADGQPIWIGSAVYDERVGLSRTTGQITHVTAPDVDVERDYLFTCLNRSQGLSEEFAIDDFHKVRQGRNGGGDPWRTDGRLMAGVLVAGARQPAP